MLCREIVAVCSEMHTKHVSTLCGQNVEFIGDKAVAAIVTSRLSRVNECQTKNTWIRCK
jgi:hypothetical protein